jgi:DNA-binding NtrC family response regulator
MSIVLYATEQLSLDAIAAILHGEGISVRTMDVEAIRDMPPFGSEIRKGVLIVRKHGAGDPTARFRRLLSSNQPLILCAPRPETDGHEMLTQIGATEIITPRSWSPEHVAERILAQLILAEEVKPFCCGDLFGGTRVMRDLYSEMKVIASLRDPILITGETGTGKELVAQEIHRLSKRPDKYQPINCGELTTELTGSEFFGHERGSFSGATDARQGLFAEAGRGTLFLDEIGELDLKAQAFLLRVLEEKKVRRVGSNRAESVPARVVLATNRDLELECREGRFRQDLFERIRGFTIEIKPLRQRRADIPLLSDRFLTQFNKEEEKNVRIPSGALDCLFSYEWPGNVRELQAAIRKAAAFADADSFMSAWRLRESTRRTVTGGKFSTAKYNCPFDPAVDTWKKFSTRAQKIYFQAALESAGGNRKEARRLTGLGNSQFYENLKAISTDEVEDEEVDELKK